MDSLESILMSRRPSAARPLLGLTVLVVEDSRFACEAIRLLCLRSGARIRRADCLRSARRHLATYRPAVVIVDLGLPDGSGAELIRDLTGQPHPRPVVLCTSGDSEGWNEAERAGADGFMPKPFESLALFQETILATLPEDRRPEGPRAVTDEHVSPDRIAFRDDLAHCADVLGAALDAPDGDVVDYLAQFLTGVARSARDSPLEAAACSLARCRKEGAPVGTELDALAGLLKARLAEPAVL